jgi:hypothetical protein
MRIPPFSIFSAVSELFVTAGVIYVIARNWGKRPFPLGLFLAVAVFEAFVNVLYMATRTARVATGTDTISTGMKIAFAAHGLLSLLAYLVFVVLGVIAWQEQRAGRYFFRERPGVTWTFAVVWAISVVSGEVMFTLRYLLRA